MISLIDWVAEPNAARASTHLRRSLFFAFPRRASLARSAGRAIVCLIAAFLSYAAPAQSTTVPDGYQTCGTGQCPVFSEEQGDTGSNSKGRKIDLSSNYNDHEYFQFDGFLGSDDERDTYRFVLPNGPSRSFYLYFLEPGSARNPDDDGAAPRGVSIKLRSESGSAVDFVNSGHLFNPNSGDAISPRAGVVSDAVGTGLPLGDCENCFARFAGVDPFLGDDPRNRPAVIIARTGLHIRQGRQFVVHIIDEDAGGDVENYRFRVGRSLPASVRGNGDGTFMSSVVSTPLPPAAWGLGAALGLFGALGAVHRRRAKRRFPVSEIPS